MSTTGGQTATCTQCQKTKPLQDFHRDRSTPSGHRSACRVCRAVTMAAYYLRVGKTLNARRRARRRRLSKWLRELRVAQGCLHCGLTHAACLDFHHRNPADKMFSIPRMAQDGHSRENIRKELEKCDVVCANCHRLLHDKRNHGQLPRKP